ncbi:bifunctional DNA-formamidopyrimidine glycosylase/DNA-(apurinic or apyrimidinic site) lyase [Actinoallomurus spadix]|uniref:Formamidopyrimidine-DNA glycosylase n=1 Tax=Actinoallomurus spadix TaxID=79912 RepID=A0ABN0XDV2_9ACTN|nr:bifunctional DNA-formamidopyrimidine glycosylase/DNA-(apurinic or apyrimidinic site) lyase [Actinoallomurus spadix]MCO5989794.1 bifunctional DNA-formamidopyrimidine glycosylase/DNA-(apurinic or apyrimidinic site) lyase [Actinoallomurus spadix]
MPELPEVEVVRRGVERWAVGRTVRTAEVLHPRSARRHTEGPADLAARMTGRTIAAARRRGKYLWLPVGDDEALLVHLGMSGQLIVDDPDRPPEKHLRARFTFTDGGPDLRFIDQRTFGHLMLTATENGIPEPIAHIAPDPLEDAFDEEAFHRALRRRRTGVKRALLDQSLISGVGNIYADEALWRAKMHWARPTETLTRAEVTRLLTGVREVMTAALEAGGTSFDSLYVNVNGESGYFSRSLNVYGRRDEPCARCGSAIRRDAFMNRSSFTCPTCQPRPRRAHS